MYVCICIYRYIKYMFNMFIQCLPENTSFKEWDVRDIQKQKN